MMALTHDVKETIRGLAQIDPDFRGALLREAVMRDCVDATLLDARLPDARLPDKEEAD